MPDYLSSKINIRKCCSRVDSISNKTRLVLIIMMMMMKIMINNAGCATACPLLHLKPV